MIHPDPDATRLVERQAGAVGETIRRRAIVTGHVQGVFFRDACRAQAERYGVAGSVSNRADGSVEAALEGPPDAVAAVLGWLDVGPPQARVYGVAVSAEDPRGDTDFRVG